MIRLLFLALIGLAATVYLVLLAKEDPGYAMISYGDWAIEGTLVLLVGVITILVTVVLVSLFLFIRTVHLPERFSRWNRNRQSLKALKLTNQGYIKLAEGEWRDAERFLSRGALNSGTPVLNYLAAARAAQESGSQRRRDNYLLLAHRSDKDAEIAVGLAQAELQLKDNQAEQALATLIRLKTTSPHHPQIIKLLFKTYKKLNSWHDLNVLLPEIKKLRLLDSDELNDFEENLYKRLFSQTASRGETEKMKDIREQMPKALKQKAEMTHYYVELMLMLGEHDYAGKLVRSAIKSEWNPSMVELFGRIREENPCKQLELAESWLKQHPKNAILLLTLGRLCFANELWGKARDYLNESIRVSPSVEALRALGELYEKHLHEPAEAMNCYRSGLALANKSSADTPPGSLRPREPLLALTH